MKQIEKTSEKKSFYFLKNVNGSILIKRKQMNNKIKYLVFVLLTLFIFGCKYSFIVPEEVPNNNNNNGNQTQPVSFASQIVPIFTAKCVACHTSGGTMPYLNAGVAYTQITPKFINTVSPETSKIYSYLLASTAGHSHKKYSSSEAALVLQWIKEGAKNN
jgi:hypothetical protein